MVTKYQKRISGPLFDRIDIHLEVPRMDYEKLSGAGMRESSESIRAGVRTARDIQRARFSKPDSKHPIYCNAEMRVGKIRQFCELQDEDQSLMRGAMSQVKLSVRAYPRILKLARTVADWRGAKTSNPRIGLKRCPTDRKSSWDNKAGGSLLRRNFASQLFCLKYCSAHLHLLSYHLSVYLLIRFPGTDGKAIYAFALY